MNSLIKISPEFLKSIYKKGHDTPDVYFHSNIGVRWLFWERFKQITSFINNTSSIKRKVCLDFGGGSGIFLPLPTKYKIYDFMRFIFKEQEPIDHYFGVDEIENTIKDVDFKFLKQKRLLFNPLSFFSVSIWNKA